MGKESRRRETTQPQDLLASCAERAKAHHQADYEKDESFVRRAEVNL